MAKYDAKQLGALKAKGQTFPGGTSYPVADGEDLDAAIHAVGRGGADHDAIRKYIIARADALGLSATIPDNWNPDGSLTPGRAMSEAGTGADMVPQKIQGHALGHTGVDPASAVTINDSHELHAAIAAVGDGISAAKDARRKHLMSEADRLGMSAAIPANWETTGGIKEGGRSDPLYGEAGFIRERFFAAADLEVRSDGRTLYGLAVPYDQVAVVNDGRGNYEESFKRGAFARTIAGNAGTRVKLMALHDSKRFPVGRATMLREESVGLVGEFHVSATRDGDDVLQLVNDKVLDSFSVWFTPVKHERNTHGVVERLEVALREVSVVAFPAYHGAAIAGVRAEHAAEYHRLIALLYEDPDSLSDSDRDALAAFLGTPERGPSTTSKPAARTSEVPADTPTAPDEYSSQARRRRLLQLRKDLP